MSRLPRVSGRDLVRALRSLGFEVDRQHSSHIIMRRTAPPHRIVVVPDHREIAKGTLRAIVRHAEISIDELSRHLG